ncbi:IS1096 element passenger TnpR family protein [Candidatus Entotheonella palauensis]|uniref:IS1096 element passenger TnpR family protein n=1 Tax=Candidatus Entotheonella palauensis TaxID=93172 RepID=UPI000B7E6950|nr:plasmid pRiA4b ORF-3 family protein [Candidatus Entotheonella palauensis]
MPRKKRKTVPPKLPLSAGEVWEIGQRPLTGLVSLPDDATVELPTMLFVVEADSGSPISGVPMMPDAPLSDWVDHLKQAMHEPMFGAPRRPEVMRVSSEAEAEVLRTGLDEAEITIEVTEVLEAVDDVHTKAMNMFGHVQNDYCAQADTAGETLSDDALRALYSVAQRFYRKALWEEFDDSEIFSIAFQTVEGQTQTNYVFLMGIMGEEFGLALYASLDDLQRVYDLDIDDVETFPPTLDEDDEEAWEASADMAAQLLSVPSISLSYTPKRDLPQPLLEEAQALKLPVAKQSAYPLMMRTGQGMQVANLADLRQIFVALHAILGWDQQVETVDLEDEIDETLTVEVPAMADALPALTAEVTLIVNPFTEDEDFVDLDDDDDAEPLISIDVNRMRELLDPSLLQELEDIDAPSQKQPKRAAPQTGDQPPAAKSNQVYTVKVFLTAGPVEAFEDEEISREILLLGHHTLHDLHQAIFDAFEREEEHLYEFNLGASPQDRSRLYFYSGGWNDDDEDTGDPTTAVFDELDLSEGQYFGYIFDMGDEWEHVIEVISIKSGPGKGKYPRMGKKIGAAPPQYPDDDEDDDDFE